LNGALWGFIGRRVWNSVRDMPVSHVLVSAMTAMTLFIFSAFLLLQENLENLLKGWGDQIQINVYLEKNLPVERVQALLSHIRDLPEVQGVRYISQEQAWKDFQQALRGQPGVLQGLPPDVLPASFEIAVKPHLRDVPRVKAFADQLQDEKGITAVEYASEWVERLSLVVVAVQWAKWLFGGVLFMATFLIVDSAIKLALMARKEEVEIMQLVGASNALISAPFVLEGMIRGVIGAALALLALWGLFRFLEHELRGVAMAVGAATGVQFLAPQTIGSILIVGWFLGAAGSLFSLRRFLQTWKN
jgi:cell division transport system permease protein